jgi:hypothetical protein
MTGMGSMAKDGSFIGFILKMPLRADDTAVHSVRPAETTRKI